MSPALAGFFRAKGGNARPHPGWITGRTQPCYNLQMRGAFVKPKPTKTLELTDRDKSIIWHAHEFRFITTNQVVRFTGSKKNSKLNDRLRDLWAEDYLVRPEIQRQVYAYRDTRETVHALGQRGAEWLAREHKISFPNGKGFEVANQIKSGTFMEHEIGVGDIMLTWPGALKGKPGLRIIREPDVVQLVYARANRRLTYPLTFPTVVRWPNGKREEVGTKPDHTFYLVDGRSDPERKALLFLEFENTKKSFAKNLMKYLKYADLYQRKLHTERFGNRMFRVLFVIRDDDPAYMQLFLAIFQQHIAGKCPPGMFLHTTLAAYERSSPLERIWFDGAGELRSLVEQ